MKRESQVIVRRGDEFLVLLRCAKDGGYWHTVAGGVEEGESFADAAARELREEVDLVATPVDLDQAYLYEGIVEGRSFVVDAAPGWEPQLNDEHDDYRWCSRADAASLFHWPETRDLVWVL